MAYKPDKPDPTIIAGTIIPITASGPLTWGREHEITGSAAVTGSIPAAPQSGAALEVKVNAAYTGSGVTITPPSGVTIDGAASFTMVAGQANQFTSNGTNILVE